MKLAFLAIARPTFDVPYSAELADAAYHVVENLADTVLGSTNLCMDDESVRLAARAWRDQDLDALVVMQASFADSTLVTTAAATTDASIVLWAAPEPRTGGRLRRNSFCGVNLAAYVLRRAERDYRYVHTDPESRDAVAALQEAIAGIQRASFGAAAPPDDPMVRSRAAEVVQRLRTTTIGIVGERPTGFEPCDFDADTARATTGVTIENVPLDHLFLRGRAADAAEVAAVSSAIAETLDLQPLDDASIEPSVRLHLGLRSLATDGGWSGLATRCWPECFTEFGGAACTAQSMLNSDLGLPALCEADAYGVVTSLVLQWLADAPSFVADLVDLDLESGTAVVWHCGLAPVEMADAATPARATIHSNRRLPLLNEFALRSGRVTVARLSQSGGRTRLVVGAGHMLEAPLPFSGTAGTMRFDSPLESVLNTIMAEGLEHHYGIVYGDVTRELHAVADELGLDVVAL